MPLLPTTPKRDREWYERKRIWKSKLRKKIWEEQKGRCYLCDVYTHLDVDPMNDFAATIDHVIAISRTHERPIQYLNSRENMKVACRKCNAEKGNMTLNEYLKKKQRKKERWKK